MRLAGWLGVVNQSGLRPDQSVLGCCVRAQKFQDDPQVVYCRALAAKGSKVTSVEDGLPTWVAEVRIGHC